MLVPPILLFSTRFFLISISKRSTLINTSLLFDMEKERNLPKMKTDITDHFNHTKLIIPYARQLQEENQNFAATIAALKGENEVLKEYNKTLLQTNINIGCDDSVTLFYAQLRERYENLLEEFDKLNITYRETLNEHSILKGNSSGIIKKLESDLKIKNETYDKEIADSKFELEQKNIYLQTSESKITNLQFEYDATMTYYNERNDRLMQENNDLKSKMSTLNKLIAEAKSEIMILKKHREQQLKKSTDLEDKLYCTENQLKVIQDKLNDTRPSVKIYGQPNKSFKNIQNRPTKLPTVDRSSYRPLNICNQSSNPSIESLDINNLTTATFMSKNNVHIDTINIENVSEMSCDVNLNVTSRTVIPRKIFTSNSIVKISDSLTLNQEVDDFEPNRSNVQDDTVKRKIKDTDTAQEYLDMAMVKGMYTNTTSKKRSRKLFDPEDN